MKTTLAILLSALAVSAHAVAFSWTSTDQISFNGTVLNTTGNTATAYLVYLGADGGWSFGTDITGTLANVTDTNVDNSPAPTSGSNTLKGKITQKTYGVNDNQGYSYGVVLKYTDSANDVWYNLSSDVYTVGSSVADNATGQSHSFAFSFANGGEVNELGTAQVGSGWHKVVAVPEPATASLALAGLALLLKRRRA